MTRKNEFIAAVAFVSAIAIFVSVVATLLISKGEAGVAYALIGFMAFFCISILVAVLVVKPRPKKPNPMALLAESLGMEYCERDPSIASDYKFLDKLAKGSSRYAYNIIRGEYQGNDTTLFHYHYQTGGKNKRSHYCSVLIIGLPSSLPELIVFKEGMFSKVAQFLGFDDIDFESAEFSREFVVRSADKKFAYDFCNAQMIEYFLENPDLQVEVERDLLMLFFKKRFSPESFRANLVRILDIRNLIPDRVFD